MHCKRPFAVSVFIIAALSLTSCSDSKDCNEPHSTCGGACVDLQTSSAHCGECGKSCGTKESCLAGVCTPAADLPPLCNGAYVDYQTNPAHCGACGNSCDASESCVAGVCSPMPSMLLCDGYYIDPQTNPAHCGGCGTSCKNGESCNDGSCVCFQDICGIECVDLQRDANHCGQCGHSCTPGMSCRDGECTPTVFAACFAAQGVTMLDDNLHFGGTFLAGYPGLEEYSLLAGLGIRQGNVSVIDIGMQGLFTYDPRGNPPVAIGPGDNIGAGANSLIIDGDYAYVIISASDLVRVIDLSASATTFGSTRLVTTIPTRIGSGTATMNPTFGTMFDDKLYVSLTGNTSGDPNGSQLIEIAVRDIDTSIAPNNPQILATRSLVFPADELVNDHPANTQNYASPAGVAAANGKLYVALGNLGAVSVAVPVGPGYLAVVDPVSWTKTLHKMPSACRNPRHVLATTSRVYVACPGLFGAGDPTEALVVLDAATMNPVKVTPFPRCEPSDPTSGPNACFVASPGRMTIADNQLVIADERSGRLFVTDLDGKVPAGMTAGIKVCNLECYIPTECYQSILDVVSIP